MIHIQHPRVSRPPSNTRSESGYILLTLILFVALLAIAAAAIAPAIVFQAKRDREEDLIHRGVQYSRAVRAYYKKFGRYPTKVEELESTNNLRFLRKRFKDPVTGQDFKLLHQQDVQMAFGPGIAGAVGAAATGAAASLQKMGGQAGLLAAAAQVQNAAQMQGVSQNTGLNQPADNADAGASDQSAPGISNQNNVGQSNVGQSNSASENSGPGIANTSGSGPGGPVYGGPIVGVVSTSKTKSIRVFNKKDHYNQWQFIYDPSTDRGGLLNSPNQPPLQNAVAPTPANGQPGAPNALGAPNMPGAITSKPLSPGVQDQPPDDKQ